MLSQSNGRTVQQFGCSSGTCSDSKVFFRLFVCCFPLQHWGCEDEIGWRTADDALGGDALKSDALDIYVICQGETLNGNVKYNFNSITKSPVKKSLTSQNTSQLIKAYHFLLKLRPQT